jgi:hypothetical protein
MSYYILLFPGLLWTAPEILRMTNPPRNGTPKADVYSFSIIVHEIITRQGTFYLDDDEKSPKGSCNYVHIFHTLFLK